MTIEEAINIIRNYDVFGCGYCHQGGNEVEEAFGMATDTMQKYQKIEQIVAKRGYIDDKYFSIKEVVLKDGNDD